MSCIKISFQNQKHSTKSNLADRRQFPFFIFKKIAFRILPFWHFFKIEENLDGKLPVLLSLNHIEPNAIRKTKPLIMLAIKWDTWNISSTCKTNLFPSNLNGRKSIFIQTLIQFSAMWNDGLFQLLPTLKYVEAKALEHWD